MKKIIVICILVTCLPKIKAQISFKEYRQLCYSSYKYNEKENINFYNPYVGNYLLKNKPINTYIVFDDKKILPDLDSLRKHHNILGFIVHSKFYDRKKKNRIMKGIETLCKIQNIKYIDLLGDENQFKIKMPQCFKEKCMELEGLKVYLSSKQLKSLLPYLYNIEWLGLTCYNLKKLPKHLHNLKNVKYLSIHSKFELELDESFLTLKNLKFFRFSLDLERVNNFTKMIDILSQVNTLETLELGFYTFPYEYRPIHAKQLNKIITSINKLSSLKKLCINIELRNIVDLKDFEEKIIKALPKTEVVIHSYK